MATRFVTVGGVHRLGMSLKLGAVAISLGLILARNALSPLAVVGALVAVLVALVVAERTLIPDSDSASEYGS